MRGRLIRGRHLLTGMALAGALPAAFGSLSHAASRGGASAGAPAASFPCPRYGRPAIAAEPGPHALRVFAIQFGQDPPAAASAAYFVHSIGCVMRREVAPYLARGRPNL